MKKIYSCKVNGNLGRVGKHFAICMKVKCGDDYRCGAHGNTKCPHKVKGLIQEKIDAK